ncbi:MAG: tripartite tricarboxylate transporter TctB family protein [Desulfobacteraceae bacterium]|nr:MAG: tripartite tricarboxylate transporter TctB family protein [Desulfobacteraceae bacterium]
MTSRTRDSFIHGGISLGAVIFLIWVIPAYSPPYPGYGVSPSLVPEIAVGAILALSGISLMRNLFSDRSAGNTERSGNTKDRVNLLHLALFMSPCVLLMPAMKWMGFIPAGAVFILVIQYLCGQRRPVPAALVTVGAVGIVYVAMRFGLGVPMP